MGHRMGGEMCYQLKKICHQIQSLKKWAQREESKPPGILAVTYVSSQRLSVASFLQDEFVPPRSYEDWWEGEKKGSTMQKGNSSIPTAQRAHRLICIRAVYTQHHSQPRCSQGKGVLFCVLCPASDQHPVPALSFPTQVHFPGHGPTENLWLSPVRLGLFCFPISTLPGKEPRAGKSAW